MSKEYDPRMHSAEHILNQTMVRMFDCGRSFSNHIEITEIENSVNQVIDKNLVVSEEFLNRNEAEPVFNLKRLPGDSGDTIRIIRIGDYDACPCSGRHVKLTNEIGRFKIISTDHKDGILRIRFKLEPPDLNI